MANVADDLTRRQRDILHAIRRLTLESGHAPSIREVAEAVGMSSPGSLHYQYRELMTKGHLRRVQGQPRTVEVRLPGEADFPARASVPDQLPGDGTPEGDGRRGLADEGRGRADGDSGRADGAGRENVVMVPIAGRIAAGGPIRAEQEIEGYLPLPREVVGRADKLFMLRVSGDSMIGVGIFPGDLVVIAPDAPHSIRKFPARTSTLPCASTFCRAETRSERRRKVSNAGIRLSSSSRSSATSGVACSVGF